MREGNGGQQKMLHSFLIDGHDKPAICYTPRTTHLVIHHCILHATTCLMEEDMDSHAGWRQHLNTQLLQCFDTAGTASALPLQSCSDNRQMFSFVDAQQRAVEQELIRR